MARGGPTGPNLAWLFHRAVAVVLGGAWLSLGAQVHVLLGPRGLLPAGDLLARARTEPGWGFVDLPTFFWWIEPSEPVLTVSVALGVLLAAIALFDVRPRLAILASTLLYLGVVNAGRDFFHFQWDNLLVETGLLAALLPAHRPAPFVHFALRVLLFKVYFESGVAKWQSHLGDWHDGSAMSFYYWTAPLPSWVGYFAHHLPAAWHHLESWLALGLELVVPCFVFGPRRLRLAALALLSGFQVVNLATASYGFFVYTTLCLHLFLLDEDDVRGLLARLGVSRTASRSEPLRGVLEGSVAILYLVIGVAGER